MSIQSSLRTKNNDNDPHSFQTMHGRAPTTWRFPLSVCPHPRHATSRWQIPGRDVDVIPINGEWWVAISHLADGPYTGGNQWIEDDPHGQFTLVFPRKDRCHHAPVVIGNALARMYADELTTPAELVDLDSGVGYFADAARICRWLGSTHGPEQQRRMSLCVEPHHYRAVLPTVKDRLAAAGWVAEQILAAETDLGPQTADGLLSALTASVPSDARVHLLHITSGIICDPRTSMWWRKQLVAGLIESRLSTSPPHETLLACALRVVTDDRIDRDVLDHAEVLLDGSPHDVD